MCEPASRRTYGYDQARKVGYESAVRFRASGVPRAREMVMLRNTLGAFRRGARLAHRQCGHNSGSLAPTHAASKHLTESNPLRRRYTPWEPTLILIAHPHGGWPMAAGPVSRLGSVEPGDETGLRLSPHLAPSTSMYPVRGAPERAARLADRRQAGRARGRFDLGGARQRGQHPGGLGGAMAAAAGAGRPTGEGRARRGGVSREAQHADTRQGGGVRS